MNKPPSSSMLVLDAAIVALSLIGCSKPSDDQRSSGQQLDEGLVKIERETEALKAEALRGAAAARQVAGEVVWDAKSKVNEVGAKVDALALKGVSEVDNRLTIKPRF